MTFPATSQANSPESTTRPAAPCGRPPRAAARRSPAASPEQLFWFRWITGHQVSFILWQLTGRLLHGPRPRAGGAPGGVHPRVLRHAPLHRLLPAARVRDAHPPQHVPAAPRVQRTWAPGLRTRPPLFRGRRAPEGAGLRAAIELHRTVHEGVAAKLVPDGRSLLQRSIRERTIHRSEIAGVIYDDYFMTRRAAVDGGAVTGQLLRGSGRWRWTSPPTASTPCGTAPPTTCRRSWPGRRPRVRADPSRHPADHRRAGRAPAGGVSDAARSDDPPRAPVAPGPRGLDPRGAAGVRPRLDLRPPHVAVVQGPALVRDRPDADGGRRGHLPHRARRARRQPELPPPGELRQGTDDAGRHLGRAARLRRGRGRGRVRRPHPGRPPAAAERAGGGSTSSWNCWTRCCATRRRPTRGPTTRRTTCGWSRAASSPRASRSPSRRRARAEWRWPRGSPTPG